MNKIPNNKEALFFIGDIHGQHHKLEQLLEHADFHPQLAGDESNHDYTHIVFLGDLIDNKPEQGADHVATLERVRSLVESGLASCVMGNHEFNAVGWSLQKPDGSYCRSHDKPGNILQHQLFLDQMGEGEGYRSAIQWFKTLPLFIDFGIARCIHACWDEKAIERIHPYLNDDNTLKEEHWYNAFDPQHELYELCETLLKGPELRLPEGHSFQDKNGTERNNIRVAWYKNGARTYRDIALVQPKERGNVPDAELPFEFHGHSSDVPVIVGHYTLPLQPGTLPEPQSRNVVCVDYNAAQKDGVLVGYTIGIFDETLEEKVNSESFVYPDKPEVRNYVTFGISQIMERFTESYPELDYGNERYSNLWDSVWRRFMTGWDPMNVFGIEECEDEYNEYIDHVCKMLVYGIEDKAETIAAYLFMVHTLVMDEEEGDNTRIQLGRIAHELTHLWEHISGAEAVTQ